MKNRLKLLIKIVHLQYIHNIYKYIIRSMQRRGCVRCTIRCSFHFQLNFNNCELKCRRRFLFAYEIQIVPHSTHDTHYFCCHFFFFSPSFFSLFLLASFELCSVSMDFLCVFLFTVCFPRCQCNENLCK